MKGKHPTTKPRDPPPARPTGATMKQPVSNQHRFNFVIRDTFLKKIQFCSQHFDLNN